MKTLKIKRVLIIGGGGFLGRCLVKELQKVSVESYIFDIQSRNHFSEAKFIFGDRHNYNQLTDLRHFDFDCVVDLIAYRPQETELAINAFLGYTKKFVHVSTFSVYEVPAISPFNETQPLTDDGSNTYMNQKAECERLLMQARKKNDFPYIIIRSAPVIGPHDNVSRENYYIKRMLVGQPIIVPGSFKIPILLVFVKDLIKAIVLAVLNDEVIGRAFHVAQKELISIYTHIQEICRLTGYSAELIPVPEEFLACAGFNLSAFPYYSGNAMYPDIDSVCNDLGLQLTPYKKALEETVSWILTKDPLSLPSWPGRITMQARMAATNDRIQFLKERAFIEEYKTAYLSNLREIESNKAKYEFNKDEMIVSKVISFFNGIPVRNSDDAFLGIMVHEEKFNQFMDSNLAGDIDVFSTLILQVPGTFFSTIDIIENPQVRKKEYENKGNKKEKCQIGKGEKNNRYLYKSPKLFKTLACLEQFQGNEEGGERYYLYTSSPGYAPYHYSHDYLFHILNLFVEKERKKREQLHPKEIDIVKVGEVFPDYIVEKICNLRNKKKITFNLSTVLNRYYYHTCFFTPGACTARKCENLVIDSNGDVKPCLWGPKIGTIDDSLNDIREKINNVVLEVEKSRGCQSCEIFDICPRCLFLKNHKPYCNILKKYPYTYRYFALYDFLRHLVRYENIDLKKESDITLEISNGPNRCLLSFLELGNKAIEKRGYRVNKGLLPVKVDNKYYVYNVYNGIIVKLTPINFLIFEVLEEWTCDPTMLEGKQFHYNNIGRLRKQDILNGINMLKNNQLILNLK